MDLSTELNGKTAIVTGAGQGMGRAVSNLLASRGANILINDINHVSAEETVRDLRVAGANVDFSVGDVTSKSDVDIMIKTAIDLFGEIHILVNTAGILRPTRLIDIEEDEWDLVVDANLKSTYLCSRAVLRPMRDSGWGRIVNFSSSAGRQYSTIGGSHYAAAKAGILGLTRRLAKEEAASGITVNAVCPGLIDTEMVRTTISDDRTNQYAESFPIPRLGEPWEVAERGGFIASDRAAYMTGVACDINGGDLMM